MRDLYGDDSPIAAFATPPGKSPLTIIRCCGKGSLEAVSSVFSRSEKLKQAPGNTVIYGWIIAAGKKIDEVLVSVFRAPKSYTGEDSFDISCHGGAVTGHAVMEALKTAGFRDALPGEFSFRAFINGKLDLTRCESVMELVCAKTETGRENAIKRLSGGLEAEINEIKKMLVQTLSGAEIFLDYSEDEIGADEDEIAGILPAQDKALNALFRLKKLSLSWQRQRIYQEGILAVIAGRPNAGKSSLFNLLLKEDRSIVTENPGTTRDWIEAWLSIEGIPIRLVDTAGLRESSDPAEKIGIQRSRHLLEEAELTLYLIDGSRGITAEDESFFTAQTGRKPLLVLWNKADIAPMPQPHFFAAKTAVSISAKTGEGIPQLCNAIAQTVRRQTLDAEEGGLQDASIGSVRQKNLVETACTALEEALAMAQEQEPLDLIAPMLREAVNALGQITGEVSTADILEEMFSRFCVGK